ncbi:MAG TPA: TlpA disulfide reductase family protein, partial [Spirochaetales bacterium]|nr:TlpA disulfide reductase family protein [Spirochaetales bacterium]
FKTLEGVDTSPALGRGKISILNFWATWCGPCRSEMPAFQILWEKTRDLPFTIIAVDVQETVSQVKSFMEIKKFTFPAYIDTNGAASARYASRGIPSTYILDKQGTILAYMIGSYEYDKPEVIALIRELCEKLP